MPAQCSSWASSNGDGPVLASSRAARRLASVRRSIKPCNAPGTPTPSPATMASRIRNRPAAASSKFPRLTRDCRKRV